MGKRQRPRLQPGRQPYDPLNGFRVGALTGALLGAVATAMTGTGTVWLVVVGAVIGGAIGFRTESRSTHPMRPDTTHADKPGPDLPDEPRS